MPAENAPGMKSQSRTLENRKGAAPKFGVFSILQLDSQNW
jgi:hypothetical protein